jgi:hypothetical protein
MACTGIPLPIHQSHVKEWLPVEIFFETLHTETYICYCPDGFSGTVFVTLKW